MQAPRNQERSLRTIRFWLNCLVFASVLPVLIVTSFLIVRFFDQERRRLEQDTIATTRALGQAVDAELKGARSALLALSASPYLASGDFASFYVEALKIVKRLGVDNVVLSDINGQQLVNTLLPYGAPLPLHGDREPLRQVIKTGEPVISGLFIGKVTGKPLIIIEAPVMVGTSLRYTLAIGLFPDRLSAILRQQKIPLNWIATIADSSQNIVGRTVGADEYVGRKVSQTLQRAINAGGEGASEGVTLEGIAVLHAFSRSSFSGWTVAIGIPEEVMFGILTDALLVNVVATVVLLAAGVLLAGVISARISGSIAALRGPAVGVGQPGPLALPPLKIQETYELGQSLLGAHRVIQQRTAERDQLRRRIMSVQEQERLRLARDLHDQTGQALAAALLELKIVEGSVAEDVQPRVHLLRKQLNDLGQVLHRIAWELRPASIDELGLAAALESHLIEWGKKHGIEVDFHCRDSNLNQRSNEIRTAIYRVIQESLTNIAKHAKGASRVSISIGVSDRTLHVTIEDNGRGFDIAAPSRLGIAGMRERLLLVGGELQIESSPVSGTTIFARIPLPAERMPA
jgi:signal transduction histidine kinase